MEQEEEAQRAEAAKGNEYFICRLLVLTIDGKQGYPAPYVRLHIYYSAYGAELAGRKCGATDGRTFAPNTIRSQEEDVAIIMHTHTSTYSLDLVVYTLVVVTSYYFLM